MTTLVGLKNWLVKKSGTFFENFFYGQEPSLSIVRDFKLMGNNDHFLFYHEAVWYSGSIHETVRRFYVVLWLFYLNLAKGCISMKDWERDFEESSVSWMWSGS